MSKARHSGVTITAGLPGPKARHSGVAIGYVSPQPKARHSGVAINPLTGLPRAHHSGVAIKTASLPVARHSGLLLSTAATGVSTQWIMTAEGLVPLGQPQTGTPPYPAWGPYGELGTYVPGLGTSGATWESGSPPSNITMTGNQTITVANTVWEGREIYGNVSIKAANVTIRNCRIWGSINAPTTNTGLIHCDNAACVNAILEDNTLRPQTPSSYWDGIRGHDYKARRNDVSGTTDGISVVNGSAPSAISNVEIDANWIHDFAYRTDPQQGDGHTHNDGTQIHGCNGVKIRGNNYSGFIDSSVSNVTKPYAGNQVSGQAILIQPQNANEVNITIQWNFFDGWGEACVHLAPKNLPSGAAGLVDNVDIWSNRYGRNQARVSSNGLQNTVRVKVSTTITNVDVPLSGDLANLYLDTLTPITVTT